MGVSQGTGLRDLVGHGAGPSLWRRLKRAGKGRKSARDVPIHVGDFVLEAPADHIIVRILKDRLQPYRDWNIGVAASYIAQHYPGAPIVDVGANIGYTAAIIATHAPDSPLVLVEASSHYYAYLDRNTRQLPNLRQTLRAFVSDQSSLRGELRHWYGTAMFVEDSSRKLEINCKPLPEIAPAGTKLVKIDTDGHDFRIIDNSLEWLQTSRSALFFENQIQNEDDLHSANALFRKLHAIGYSQCVFWDDPGWHMVSTTDLDVMDGLNRYLFMQHQRQRGRPSVYNYDVLCLPAEDKKIFDQVTTYYQHY